MAVILTGPRVWVWTALFWHVMPLTVETCVKEHTAIVIIFAVYILPRCRLLFLSVTGMRGHQILSLDIVCGLRMFHH